MKKKWILSVVLLLLLTVQLTAGATVYCVKWNDAWVDYTVNTTAGANAPAQCVSLSYAEASNLVRKARLDVRSHVLWENKEAYIGPTGVKPQGGDFYVSGRAAHNCANFAEVAADTAATCTAAGTQGRTVCSGCGEVVNEGKTLPAEHKAAYHIVFSIAEGFRGWEGSYCSRCGQIFVERYGETVENPAAYLTASSLDGTEFELRGMLFRTLGSPAVLAFSLSESGGRVSFTAEDIALLQQEEIEKVEAVLNYGKTGIVLRVQDIADLLTDGESSFVMTVDLSCHGPVTYALVSADGTETPCDCSCTVR